MKKAFAIIGAILLVLIAVSCGSKPAPQDDRMSGLPDIVRNARRNAPEGVLIGVGSAKLASQNQSKVVGNPCPR